MVGGFSLLFPKSSKNDRGNSPRFNTKDTSRKNEYLSNSNKIMDMDVDFKLKMKIPRKELRMLLLLKFLLDRDTTEATSNICGMMGKNVLSVRTAQHFFHRFKNGNFEFDELPRTGRPLQVDMDLLKQLIEEDLRLTTRCLAE